MGLRPASGAIPSGIHRTSTQPVDNYSDIDPPVDNSDRSTPNSRPTQGRYVKASRAFCPVQGS